MTELSDIFSQGRKIKIGQNEVEIKGLSLGDLPILLGLVSKYFDATKGSKGDIKQIAIKILSEDFESVLKLFEVATNLKPEEVRSLNMAASIIILTEVIKDNADFFSQHVAPALESMGKISLKAK